MNEVNRDDHSAMRRLMGRVVSYMVSEIEECGDSAKALNTYHRCLPDWVLRTSKWTRTELTETREILLSYPRARVVIVNKHDDDHTRSGPPAADCGYALKENLMVIRELRPETGL